MAPVGGKRAIVDRPVVLALLFFAAYLLTWAGHMDNGDSSYRIAWAKSMLFHHTARIDDAGLGAAYCKYSIGHSLVAMPFLAVAEVVKRIAHVHMEGPIYMLLFVGNAALFMALVAKYLRLEYSVLATRRTLLLLGFCTVWLPCSRMDSIEQLVLTCLFGGFLAAKLGRPVLGMAIASFAITIRPDAIIAVGLFGIWHLFVSQKIKTAAWMALAVLPALLTNAGANWVRWGTITEAGYAGETWSEPFLTGLHGMLFSAGKSIFLYSPPLLLGIWGLLRARKKRRVSPDFWFFAGVLISEILLYAKWWDWSGDDCWSIRFLNPGVMLLCIPAVELLGARRWPKPAVALAFAGLCVQSLAVLVDPLASDYVIRNYHLPRIQLYPGQRPGTQNRLDLEDMRFNPRYSPLATNWLMLRLLFHLPPERGNPKEWERIGTPLYDSLLASGWDPRTVSCDLFWVRLVTNRK